MKRLLLLSLFVSLFGEASAEETPSFRRDVMPVLFRAGCNAGTCHGSARGKDGFMLSLFGYDAKGDYYRITQEMVGRRVNLAAPEESLLLLKAIGKVPHTGGELFTKDTPYYKTLLGWIEAGAPDDADSVPQPVGITLTPDRLVFEGGKGTEKTVVTARYSDGTTRDVTNLALFLTNNPATAKIDKNGVVSATGRGDTYVFARFNRFTVGSEVIVLPDDKNYTWTNPKAHNYIDEIVHDRLQKLRLLPSEVCDDETFIRRLHLDLTGSLPTVDEVRAFLADASPDKRTVLIDRLLKSDGFTDLWTALWAELLRVKGGGYAPSATDVKAADVYYDWIREQIAANRPLNEFVADQITGTGSNLTSGPANLYTMLVHDVKVTPKNLAADFSQLFTGVRIQCAECHNHPFDRWTMDDYYGFKAFFSQIGRKPTDDPQEVIIYNSKGGESRHFLTNAVMKPKFLGGEEPEIKPGEDRRKVLAEWIASPKNPFFARNISNIVWAHFFGVGIVDPVDDVRVSNPPSNPELLTALAGKLTEYKYDFRRFVKDICTSMTYQRSTKVNETNAGDKRNFSHALVRRVRAEILLDAISQITETPNKFQGLPLGARAVQIADGAVSNYFLTTFGRAKRESVCSCEVKMEPTLSQALHLMNGDAVNDRIKQGKVVAKLIAEKKTDREIVEDLYLRVFGRLPKDKEWTTIQQTLANSADQRQAALEDTFWALMNSKEFYFNH